MYSGTTLGKSSGNAVGAHQRIDRIARRNLTHLIDESQGYFPSSRDILYFEGNKGPDAVKRKSPSIDEPWHYIDPKTLKDTSLLAIIDDHIVNLSLALRAGDAHRAAFEAAWLAHAVVDGLTPAHHFPLADKIEELFGMPHHERKTIKEKNIIRGDSRRDTVAKNWEYWGAKGVFSAHALFEHGVSSSLLTWRYTGIVALADAERALHDGYQSYFLRVLREIDSFGMYDVFQKSGWTTRTVRLVRRELFPRLVEAVTVAWFIAYKKAHL